nr:Gag-Pol polyprotein [Tanacetum cinerariifolium]
YSSWLNNNNKSFSLIKLSSSSKALEDNRNGNVVAAQAKGNGNGNNRNQVRCYNCKGMGHLARNCIVRPRRRDAPYIQTQLLFAQKDEARIQLQAEEFDLMAVVGDLDEIDKCSRYSIGDGFQHYVDFVGHLALLLFEIDFKLGQSGVLRCNEVGHQSFEILLIVNILRIFVEGKVWDQAIGSEPVRWVRKTILRILGLSTPKARMHISQRLILDFPCSIECHGDYYRSHIKSVSVTRLTTDRLVNGSSCARSDMVIKDLDLEPKIDAMMRDFLDPSWLKELSKEISSKILPCSVGAYWKTFKPVASLIAFMYGYCKNHKKRAKNWTK